MVWALVHVWSVSGGHVGVVAIDRTEVWWDAASHLVSTSPSMEPRPSGKCRAVAKSSKDNNGNGGGDNVVPFPKPYNDPTLPPMEFLLAVMHDPNMPIPARIDAAKAVSVYMHPRLAQVTQEVNAGIKIIIEGGLPALPGTNIIMPQPGSKTNGSGEPPEE